MKLLYVMILIASLSSCASLVGKEEAVTRQLEGLSAAAPALDLVTGGWATPLTGAAGTLAAGIFALNRAMLAKRRGDAIKQIDKNPDTPPAMEQVVGSNAKRIIIQIVAQGDTNGSEHQD